MKRFSILIVAVMAVAGISAVSMSQAASCCDDHQAERKTQPVSRAYLGARNVPASGVAIDGFSPVSYFESGRAEKGDPLFSVEHNGLTYHLTSQHQVELFKQAPSRYEPQLGGWCAFGMAVSDKFPIDPTRFSVIDGRLYLFLRNADVDALALWNDGEPGALLAKAHAHWRKVSGK